MSPILKRVVYPWLANSGYLRRRRAGGGSFCVITYHGVLPENYQPLESQEDGSQVSPENFRSQLRLLKECYKVVTPEQVRAWLMEDKALPELSVLLTCDDGLKSSLTAMVPMLKEEGLTCLFFVLGGALAEKSAMLWYEQLYLMLLAAPSGNYNFPVADLSVQLGERQHRRTTWWNLVKDLSRCDQAARVNFLESARLAFGLAVDWNIACLSTEPQRQRCSLLNVADLRQLLNQGMSVGSHTLNHPILSLQSTAEAYREISESRTVLECALGSPVWALAYPFGDPASVSDREMLMAEQAGFQCAFMNVGGGFGAQLPRFALPRVHVTADMNLSEFEAHVSGFHRDFRSRLSRDTA